MGKVNVVIVDATGNKEQKVGLPDDIKCGIILLFVFNGGDNLATKAYLIRNGSTYRRKAHHNTNNT